MTNWKREYSGRYISLKTGVVIEKSNDRPVWLVINPETGRVLDSLKTKTEAQRIYE